MTRLKNLKQYSLQLLNYYEIQYNNNSTERKKEKKKHKINYTTVLKQTIIFKVKNIGEKIVTDFWKFKKKITSSY